MELITVLLFNGTSTNIEVLFKYKNKEYNFSMLKNKFSEDIEEKELLEALQALKEHKIYNDLKELQEMHIIVDDKGEQSEDFTDKMNDLEYMIVDERIEL